MLCACAPKPVIKRVATYDFSHIKSLFVARFDGEGGAEVTKACVQDLAGRGLKLVDRPRQADAILTGVVTDYQTNQELMVFLEHANVITADNQTVAVSNPVVFPGGTPVVPIGHALGQSSDQIVSSIASVNIVARLIDGPTGHLIWTDEARYEGLDVPGAVQPVAQVLGRALESVIHAR